MAKRKSSDEAEITDEEKQAALDDADALIDETWADTNGNVGKLMLRALCSICTGSPCGSVTCESS